MPLAAVASPSPSSAGGDTWPEWPTDYGAAGDAATASASTNLGAISTKLALVKGRSYWWPPPPYPASVRSNPSLTVYTAHSPSANHLLLAACCERPACLLTYSLTTLTTITAGSRSTAPLPPPPTKAVRWACAYMRQPHPTASRSRGARSLAAHRWDGIVCAAHFCVAHFCVAHFCVAHFCVAHSVLPYSVARCLLESPVLPAYSVLPISVLPIFL